MMQVKCKCGATLNVAGLWLRDYSDSTNGIAPRSSYVCDGCGETVLAPEWVPEKEDKNTHTPRGK